jgi:hypothetical protein
MEGPHVTTCEPMFFLWCPRIGGRQRDSHDKRNTAPNPSIRAYLRSGVRASAVRILKLSAESKVTTFVSSADEGKISQLS